MPGHTAVVVPVYQAEPSVPERFSLEHSLPLVASRDVFFVAPNHLDTGYYERSFPGVPVVRFDNDYFASIKGYNHLLLSRHFYERFAEHQFMLVLQTDALLLRDDLDLWAARPYDYVGAPWPDGVEVFVNLDQFEGDQGKRVRAHVGNGGLSLRRISKCLALLDEFPNALNMFRQSGSSEDLFFAIMGALSGDFIVPGEMTAATFALELRPRHYFAANRQQAPMGGHAWWKYDLGFWQERLGRPLPFDVPAAPSQ